MSSFASLESLAGVTLIFSDLKFSEFSSDHSCSESVPENLSESDSISIFLTLVAAFRFRKLQSTLVCLNLRR